MLGITSRSDLQIVIVGLFLGWVSLSFGAPIRLQETVAVDGSNSTNRLLDQPNSTTAFKPTPESTRPWNETKTQQPQVPTVDAGNGNSMGILANSSVPGTDNMKDTTMSASTTTNSIGQRNASSSAEAADGANVDSNSETNNTPQDGASDAGANHEEEGDDQTVDGNSDKNPCNKLMCTPVIDVNASVIESYKRHRAQAALIGDFGTCISGPGTGRKPDGNSTSYTWTVDWGDDESYELKKDKIGPYQAEHVYAKKGKYTVEATFCHNIDGCDSGCTTYSKTIKVKP